MEKQLKWDRPEYRYQYKPTRVPKPKPPRMKALSEKERATQWMERADKALTYHDRIRAIRFVHRARVAFGVDGTGRSVADAMSPQRDMVPA